REPNALAFEWQTRAEWDRPPQITPEACASDVEDEYRFGLEELRRICHPWGYPIELTRIAKELRRPALVRERWAQFAGHPSGDARCRVAESVFELIFWGASVTQTIASIGSWSSRAHGLQIRPKKF